MRLPDWPTLLQDEIAAGAARPWAWGSHDCLQFAARCVEAITGEDLAAQFGAYTDERGAAQLLAEHGGVEGLLTIALGDPVARLLARRGDVVTTTLTGRTTAGICLGPVCVFAAAEGVEFASLEVIESVWRVD